MKTVLTRFALVLLVSAVSTFGATLTFSCIPDPDITTECDPDVGSQLSLDIVEVIGGTQLTFSNIGPTPSTITSIYFDLPSINYFSSLTITGQSDGVDFQTPVQSSANLPRGNNLDPDFSTNWAVERANPGGAANGIDPPDEWLQLLAGVDYTTLINDLTDGDVRIGLHVQRLGEGGALSDGYINEPPLSEPPDVPEPATLALMGAGLLAVGALKRRQQTKNS